MINKSHGSSSSSNGCAIAIVIALTMGVAVLTMIIILVVEVNEARYFARRWGETSFSTAPYRGKLTSAPLSISDKKEKCDRALTCLSVVDAALLSAQTGNPIVSPPGVSSLVVKSYPGHPALVCFFTEETRRWIAYRGTLNYEELINDDFELNYAKEHYQSQARLLLEAGLPTLFSAPQIQWKAWSKAKVHLGFQSLYELTAADVKAFVDVDRSTPVHVGGHSLGAGLAAMCAADLASQGEVHIRAFLCACPRPGNADFTQYLQSQTDCCTFMNVEDAITNSPPPVTPDFENNNGTVEYCMPPNLVSFGVQGDSLEANHSIKSYKLGIDAVRSTL